MASTITIQRESVEFIAVTTLSRATGAPAEDVEYAITPGTAERPSAWIEPVEVDEAQGVMVDAPDLGLGKFRVWVRITAGDQEVVKLAGEFKII